MNPLLIWLVLSSILCASQPKEIKYRVGNIPVESAKFQRIYESCARSELFSKAQGAKREKSTIKIFQHIEGRSYLFTYTPHYREILGKITLDQGRQLIDGESVTVILEETADTFQYTTALGTKKTVRVYKEGKDAPVPERMSKEQFITKLKSGRVFTIKMGYTDQKCSNCHGFGRVHDRSSSLRSGDGKVVCPSCKGQPLPRVPKLYAISW